MDEMQRLRRDLAVQIDHANKLEEQQSELAAHHDAYCTCDQTATELMRQRER